ncbi:MAG TPA: endolytic transglycosylase MltG [Microbacterium sp.]|uniref:endolytic transglycosylase MltG n=1 Tax=Microbacterium sp. TaxID=51671 RepID=UPI002CCCDAE6|nr:endolytic transglycosylase MltG [Microbacterium sp.]HWI31715.1 endolytic transglycosylase MltG [Microbacterium sp.]
MPDPSSTSDDPFSDLYGKLPDPKARADDSAAPAPTTSPVPLSRRAAREAATGPSPAQVTPAPAPATVPPSPTAAVPVVVPSPRAEARASTTVAEPTIDHLFSADSHAEHTVPPAAKRRKRRRGCLVALVILALIFGGIAAAGIWVWNTYESNIRSVMGWEEPKDYAEGLATGEALVTINSGDGGEAISQSLYEAGVTKTPDAFYAMLITQPTQPIFYPGVYRLQQKMTSAAALVALEDPANKLENSAVLPEGLTLDQTLEELASSLAMPIEDFQAAVADPAAYGVAASSLEGWLFPAMYTFDPGVTAPQIIQTMVDRAVSSLDAAGVAVEQRQDILTRASIIQREARLEEDFYKVSRVIQNRLDIGMQLQMDSTSQYGYGELHDGTVSTSGEAQYDDNPWNTYVIPGLPVGPISNPGDVAIDAAMHPADGPWLFFVTWNLDTGETIFTSTDAEHEAAKEKWAQWCEENPDGGC